MEPEFALPKSKTHDRFVTSQRKKVIITHNDLDGISCKIVANMFLDTTGKYNFEQLYPDNWSHIFQNVKQLEDFIKKNGVRIIGNNPFLLEEKDYLITDLNVSMQIAKWIDVLNKSKIGSKIWILDHHASGIGLAKYPWCYVEVEHQWSATKLVYDLHRSNLPYSQLATRYFTGEDATLDIYVKAVNAYDTGDFGSEYGKLGIMLNRAFVELGWKKYAYLIQNGLYDSCIGANTSSVVRTEGLQLMYDGENGLKAIKIPHEIKEAAKDREKKDEHRYRSMCESSYTMTEHNFGDSNYAVDVIIGSSFGNDVNAYRYLVEHPSTDILATLNLVSGTCSLRTIRKDLNLAGIASKFGGGGHASAAAFSISPETVVVKQKNSEFHLIRKVVYKK